MNALLLCVALFTAQTPAQRTAQPPAARATRDTIYVAVQPPPPTIVVDWPTVVLGIVGLVLVFLQMRIMRTQTRIMGGQTDAMNTQSALMAKQTALEEQQAEWQRAEAAAALHRLLSDLAAELSHSVGVHANQPVPVEANPHPRQLLRDAPRVFAPLGASITVLLNEVGFALDRYYDALTAYNKNGVMIPDVDVNLGAAVEWRRHIGAKMDKTSSQLRHLGLEDPPIDAARPGAPRSIETFEDMVVYMAQRRAWVIKTRT